MDDADVKSAVFLNVDQTRMVIKKAQELFCATLPDITPTDVNAGIFLGFGMHRIMRGSSEWVSYEKNHIEYKPSSPPKYLVKLPPTKTNKIQHNINRQPFEVEGGTPLFALMELYLDRRGSHIDKTGLFLHPLPTFRVYFHSVYIYMCIYLFVNNKYSEARRCYNRLEKYKYRS